jgi:hypothetical protein
MAEGQSDVVLFDYEERGGSGSFGVRRFDPLEARRDPRAYAILNQINPFCGLYRRTAFLSAGGYDEDPTVLFNEDVAMHIGLAFAGLSFAVETEVAIINHHRANSMSGANQLKCARAHYHVLIKTAERQGAAAYSALIAAKLWRTAGLLAAHLDWSTADAAARAAQALAPSVVEGSIGFRALAGVSAPLALRVRERLIRALRPRDRVGLPCDNSDAGADRLRRGKCAK